MIESPPAQPTHRREWFPGDPRAEALGRRRAPASWIFALVFLLLPFPGCDQPRDPPVTTFEPATVSEGDSVLGLRVAAKDVQLMPGPDSIWVGSVQLEGELELQGVYQAHFDYPDVPALCFHPAWASAARIPAFHPDEHTAPDRKRWFCFTNPVRAAEEIGPPDQPREATVVVRDYRVVRRFTDAWETAELVRVEKVGRPRTATLREPSPQPRLMRDSIPTSEPIRR